MSLRGCVDCVVHLGVSKLLTVSDGRGLILSSVSDGLHISDLRASKLHFYSAARPVAVHNVHDVQLAPYNTHYPRLHADLEASGLACRLSVSLSRWRVLVERRGLLWVLILC